MSRKVISVILFVVAGFFLYGTSLLAFIRPAAMPNNAGAPPWVKFAVMGAFFLPGGIAHLIGLAIGKFRHWRRRTGIVLVSGAGSGAFIVLSFACFLLSPEIKRFMPPAVPAFFSDYVSGTLFLVFLLGAGTMLILGDRQAEEE